MKGDGALVKIDGEPPRFVELLRMMEPAKRHRHVLSLAYDRFRNITTGWQTELARALERDPRTVRRWVRDDKYMNGNPDRADHAMGFCEALAIWAVSTQP